MTTKEQAAQAVIGAAVRWAHASRDDGDTDVRLYDAVKAYAESLPAEPSVTVPEQSVEAYVLTNLLRLPRETQMKIINHVIGDKPSVTVPETWEEFSDPVGCGGHAYAMRDGEIDLTTFDPLVCGMLPYSIPCTPKHCPRKPEVNP